MELTLSVLVRVRALFDAGASVEEVYETLGVPGIPTRNDGASLLARVRAGLDETTDLAALSQDMARLAELIERLREDVQAGVVMPFHQPQAQQPNAPVQAPAPVQAQAQQAGADLTPATQPSPQADVSPRPPAPPVTPPVTPAVASEGAPAQKAPGPDARQPGKAAPDPVDLRDQIAVAVTRISMLMGQEGSRFGEDTKDRPRRAS